MEKLHNSSLDPNDYSEPVKITIEYSSGFDLLVRCLGEGGLFEESESRWNEEEKKRNSSNVDEY